MINLRNLQEVITTDFNFEKYSFILNCFLH